MGAANSKITHESTTLNETDLDLDISTFNEIQQSCTSISNQRNVLNIIGSKVKNLSTNQTNISKNFCLLTSALSDAKDTGVETNILNKIRTAAEAKGGFPGMGADSDTLIKTMNVLKVKLDASTINKIVKDCILSQNQSNVINIIASSVDDTDISQLNNAIAECIQKHESVTSAITDIKEKVETDTSSTAKVEGGNPIKDFFGGIGGLLGIGPTFMIVISVILIIACLVSSGLSAYMGMSGSPAATTGRANIGKAFSQLQAMQSGVPNQLGAPSGSKSSFELPKYENFEFLGSFAKNLMKIKK